MRRHCVKPVKSRTVGVELFDREARLDRLVACESGLLDGLCVEARLAQLGGGATSGLELGRRVAEGGWVG